MEPDSTGRCAILMIVDGLRPSALGPYGNTWFDTHSFNQLASKSLVFEQCITDCPDPMLGFNGLISGQHCCTTAEDYSNPFDEISKGGVESVLITDSDRSSDIHERFEKVIEVESNSNSKPAPDVSETGLANFFALAIQAIREIDQPVFLVLECSGLAGCWDAPMHLREQLRDEEDPDPLDLVVPPKLQFNEAADDPDFVVWISRLLMVPKLLSLIDCLVYYWRKSKITRHCEIHCLV